MLPKLLSIDSLALDFTRVSVAIPFRFQGKFEELEKEERCEFITAISVQVQYILDMERCLLEMTAR